MDSYGELGRRATGPTRHDAVSMFCDPADVAEHVDDHVADVVEAGCFGCYDVVLRRDVGGYGNCQTPDVLPQVDGDVDVVVVEEAEAEAEAALALYVDIPEGGYGAAPKPARVGGVRAVPSETLFPRQTLQSDSRRFQALAR